MAGIDGGLRGSEVVEAVRLGARQVHGPLAVFPLWMRSEDGPSYVTLRRALSEGTVVVTEVDEDGSVPELRLVNKGDVRVLVLDGEELHGARQNRILNTSILVDKHEAVVVPVSCTEQGRWSYTTREFASSEFLADRSVRHAMGKSVARALVAGAGHRSDQGRVWSEVAALHARHGTASPTAAMRDAYRNRRPGLDPYLAAFPLQDGQQGMLVLHGAHVVGLDLVSRAAQYAELHERLLSSYAFEALVRDGEPGDRAVADEFLERIAALSASRHKSPGLGWDARFEGDGVLGSVLVYRGHVVHAAFFRTGDARGAEGQTRADHHARDAGGTGAAWRIADPRERARRRKMR